MNPNKNIPEEKIFFFDNHSIEFVQDLKRAVETPNKYKEKSQNFKILKKIRINSSLIKIKKIPMPRPIYINKIRVPASYLNFYIFNKFVLLPTFKDPKDKIVIKIFKKEFNNRKIIPVDCSELIWGFGAIHCLTQQEPK